MRTELLLVIYCLLIVVASMAGGWLPSLMRMTHLRTQLLMSFVAGLMLAIAMLHLLPHSVESLGSPSKACAAVLGGVVVMFLLMRLFHPHEHGIEEGGHSHGATCNHDHGPDAHGHNHTHETAEDRKTLNWVGMIFGLGLHTLIDGVALAASVVADAEHGAWLGLAGLGTFLAVALHKPLDAFAITSVMKKDGWSVRGRNAANFAFSLACPLGALLFYFGATELDGGGNLLGWGLALSAGFFICIALSDLLPEVAFHDHDRFKLTAALLVGVALAIGIENLPGHSHGTGAHDHAGHDHAGHDHAGHDHAGHDH
jgi:zinc and cadmium transporter